MLPKEKVFYLSSKWLRSFSIQADLLVVELKGHTSLERARLES